MFIEKNRYILCIVLLLCGLQIMAQRQTSSPFTRYGYGDLFTNTTVYNQAMGGISVGVSTPTQINFANAASQAFIKKESFLFSINGGANVRHAIDNGNSATLTSVGFESFSMGFPIIANRWGMAVGCLPFNSVGYSMSSSNETVKYLYKGDGGANQFALSTGVRVFKGLSLGANVAYMFGTTYYTAENEFSDASAFSTRKEQELKTHGLIWNLGAQYKLELKEGQSLTLGLTYRSGQSVGYKQIESLTSYFVSTYTEFQKDTAVMHTFESNTDIPMEFAVGVSYSYENKLLAGVDFGLQNLKDLSVYGTKDNKLESTKFVRLGGEWIPNYRSSKLIKRIPIRMGLHYADLPIMFESNGEFAQAKEIGLSLGTRIKSKHTQNSLAIAFDFGTRGNKSLANSLHETYMLAKFNVSLQEVWFIKRKIN